MLSYRGRRDGRAVAVDLFSQLGRRVDRHGLVALDRRLELIVRHLGNADRGLFLIFR